MRETARRMSQEDLDAIARFWLTATQAADAGDHEMRAIRPRDVRAVGSSDNAASGQLAALRGASRRAMPSFGPS